jgi:hypothetical protein
LPFTCAYVVRDGGRFYVYGAKRTLWHEELHHGDVVTLQSSLNAQVMFATVIHNRHLKLKMSGRTSARSSRRADDVDESQPAVAPRNPGSCMHPLK